MRGRFDELARWLAGHGVSDAEIDAIEKPLTGPGHTVDRLDLHDGQFHVERVGIDVFEVNEPAALREDVLYVRVPVTVTDPEFTDDTVLAENAVHAIEFWLDKGQAENEAKFGDGPYHLDTHDVTVWTEAAFTEDLRDFGDDRSRELDNVRFPVKP